MAGAGLREGRLEIDTTALEDYDLEPVGDAVRAAADELLRQREWERAENERYREFAVRLEDQLGSAPREGGE